jgi:toxin YoeB
MDKYFIDITDQAREDIRHWHKVGDEVILKKIKRILLELSEHQTKGTGRVEPLRGNLAGCWSRRLNHKHRMVYEITDKTVTVLVLSLRGHYGDS